MIRGLQTSIFGWLYYNPASFSICKLKKIMKSDEKRSHRLNHLLKYYLSNPQENSLYQKAKLMGVSDSTAKDYIRTVIIQAQKIHSRQN